MGQYMCVHLVSVYIYLVCGVYTFVCGNYIILSYAGACAKHSGRLSHVAL